MSNQKQTQKVIEKEIEEISEATIGEIVKAEIDTADKQSAETSKFVSKDDVIEIITSAKARASRIAQTSISMSCREVLAMLNGIKDGVEKL